MRFSLVLFCAVILLGCSDKNVPTNSDTNFVFRGVYNGKISYDSLDHYNLPESDSDFIEIDFDLDSSYQFKVGTEIDTIGYCQFGNGFVEYPDGVVLFNDRTISVRICIASPLDYINGEFELRHERDKVVLTQTKGMNNLRANIRIELNR